MLRQVQQTKLCRISIASTTIFPRIADASFTTTVATTAGTATDACLLDLLAPETNSVCALFEAVRLEVRVWLLKTLQVKDLCTQTSQLKAETLE